MTGVDPFVPLNQAYEGVAPGDSGVPVSPSAERKPCVHGNSVATLADGSTVPIACFNVGYFHFDEVAGTRVWGMDGSAGGEFPNLVSIDGRPVADFNDGGTPRHVGLLPQEEAKALGTPSRGAPDVLSFVQPTGTSRRCEILDRIASCVCKDRQNSYGDAEDNFVNIAAYWNLWLKQRGLLAPGKEVDALDVAQMSSFIKIARKVGSLSYLDNWVDDGGYSVCGAGIVLSREVKT